jgi:hypothetical protein
VLVGRAGEHELAAVGGVEDVGEQLGELVDDDSLVAKLARERVVLLAGACRPHHVVEEELVDVARCQARELEPGSVHDDLPQLTDLGVDVEGCCGRGGHDDS